VRRHGFLAAMLLGTAATTGWVLHRYSSLDASEETTGSFREALSRAEAEVSATEDPNGVRLNYFETTWDRVLRNIAEQQDLTLIMDEVPPGRYARRDRKLYDPGSAIRILNSELEPQGYRLLLQNNYLIVLNLDQARTEYARPRMSNSSLTKDIGAAESDASGEGAFRPGDTPSRPVSMAPLRKNRDGRGVTVDTQEPARNTDGRRSGDRFGVPVTPVSQTSSADEPQGHSAGADAGTSQGSQVAVSQPSGPMEVQSFSCSTNRAADLARNIYLVFEKRAELQRDGIQGLPSFAVFQPATDSQVATARVPLFRIGIDQSENRLLIEAPSNRMGHLRSLLTELDRPAQLSEETVRLVPNNGLGIKTAKELNEQIHQLVSMRAANGGVMPGAVAGNPFAQDQAAAGQNAANPMPQPPGAAGAPQAGDEPEPGDSLNLRGEVNVQSMQDLGILILKGNEADVNKVAEIINTLERMSVGSVPDIHILTLKNVNSEAMAELMTAVYDRLSELRQRGTSTRKTAAFIPVVQPNAILILAPEIEMESVLKLANELDQPLEPEFEFQVFPLKNAIASQVLTALDSFYAEPSGLRTRPRSVADVRTNSVIVQGRPNDLKEVGALIEKIDKDESGAVHRVQIFRLNNAVAEELSTTISSAIQAVINPPQQQGQAGGLAGFGAGTQGAQELRASKSVALEFLANDGAARQLVKSGILADVRVNADVRSNSLIVSAPEASMGLMAALIAELDRSPTATAEIKVFTLQNADAEQSVELLETLFENQNNQDQLGIQISGTEDAASSLIPLRFSADIRTNTVLAVGGGEALSVVEAILLRLDMSDVRQRTTEVIQLRNAPAELVSTSLNTYLEQMAGLQDSSEDLVSNIERLRQEVIIAEDINSNSLIVSASPSYFSTITRVIEALDSTPPEVVIQALLVEVRLDQTDEFGIELGFQDPLLLTRNLTATTLPGLNFNNTSVALGNNSANAATNGIVGTQGLTNFSLGRTNENEGFGGFVFSAQSDAVSVLLRALAARRTVQVLSRPQVRTTHNNEAYVNVGQNVPVVNGITITAQGLANPTVERVQTGITLRVTPRITPDGIIAMAVFAEKSALSEIGVPIFVNSLDGSTVDSPIIDQQVAETTVNVPNGQTIVIGGLITKADGTLERKVPWLGDLPIVGNAFRYDGTSTSRSELLIFLTPRIIMNDLDSELIKQIEAERMHFIESDAEEVHGPLYSVPPAGASMQGSDMSQDPAAMPEMVFPAQTQNSAEGSGKPAEPAAASQTAKVQSVSARRTVTTDKPAVNQKAKTESVAATDGESASVKTKAAPAVRTRQVP
jgi:general secretion pathway protein D